jgi:leucine dehydrogenase
LAAGVTIGLLEVFFRASKPGSAGPTVGSLEHEPLKAAAQATKLRVRLNLIVSRTITDPQGDKHLPYKLELLETMALEGHEQILAVQDAPSGLRAWIAIHALDPQPAFGGIRILNYRSERDALFDALRLSRIMTYKCALAGVRGSGAKTVVISNSITDRPAAIRVLGRHIEGLGGIYRAGPDAGFTSEDQQVLMEETQYIAHFGVDGGMQSAGDATAEGAMHGILRALKLRSELQIEETTVAIQGLGSVGVSLAKRFLELGARVVGADVDSSKIAFAQNLGVTIVPPSKILSTSCDVLVPCAMGGTIHDVSIPRIQASIVAGVANNTLGHDSQAALLKENNITFLPDFALNAGALIEGSHNLHTDENSCPQKLAGIGETIANILQRSDDDKLSTIEAAFALASEKVIATKSH